MLVAPRPVPQRSPPTTLAPTRRIACRAKPVQYTPAQRVQPLRHTPPAPCIDPLLDTDEAGPIISCNAQLPVGGSEARSAPAAAYSRCADSGTAHVLAAAGAAGFLDAAASQGTESDADDAFSGVVWSASADTDLAAALQLQSHLSRGDHPSTVAPAGAAPARWWAAPPQQQRGRRPGPSPAAAATSGVEGGAGARGGDAATGGGSGGGRAGYLSSRSEALRALKLQQDRRLRQLPPLSPHPHAWRPLYWYRLDGQGNVVRVRAPKERTKPFARALTAAPRPAAPAVARLPPLAPAAASAGAGAGAGGPRWRVGLDPVAARTGEAGTAAAAGDPDDPGDRPVDASRGDEAAAAAASGDAGARAPSAAGSDTDPTRGLRLSVFLYCATQARVEAALWELQLPAGCLRYVTRVADADLVLHTHPRPGEKHFQYAMFREQAAARGIPFVSVRAIAALELRLALLPVFLLYAGELTPREAKRQLVGPRVRHNRRIKL